ncbi:acyltransferase family protein [Ottowia sp.]|uniref:acyltransferase family protein n=1 Tax=Ottowia sp. TaxID=1898956 RepID=UPI0039E32BC4
MTSRPRNEFDTLRICAAVAVIFSHHFALTGTPAPAWLNFGMVGGVAVMAFFTISGYLVMQSWLREPRLARFLWKRWLRVWPGVLVAVATNILLFGLPFTALPAADFLRHPQTLDYVRNLLLYEAFVDLPGTFLGNPYPQVMNGPLWTIPMESLCYAVLAAAGALGGLRSRRVASALCAAYLAFFLTQRNADLTGEMHHWYEYSAYFAHGALIALHRDSFHAHARRWVLALLPVAAVLFLALGLRHTAGLLLPPLLIHLGSRHAPALAPLHRWGDPSYGVYLFGFPMAQMVQASWPGLPFAASLALTIALALAAGCASWHGVESRALRLKDWTPGRTAARRLEG